MKKDIYFSKNKIDFRPAMLAIVRKGLQVVKKDGYFFPLKSETGESSIVALLINITYTWRVAQDWLKAGLNRIKNILKSRAVWRLKSLH